MVGKQYARTSGSEQQGLKQKNKLSVPTANTYRF